MRVRWWVCLLLFLTWLLSYMDRSLMPMALPFIGREFHLSPTAMGAVISAFFLGYGSMQIPGGIVADKFGPRKSVALGVFFWSVFSLLTGATSSLSQLMGVQVLFGLGEGIHPPAAFKTISAWFGSTERARANGLVMSSNTLGPMIAPILFAAVMAPFGWRIAFYLISIPGFLVAMVVFWYLRDKPNEHPGITKSELAEIGAPNDAHQKSSFSALLKHPVLWQLFFIYMAWDLTWWGFQAWLPSYLLKARGFTLLHTGIITALPFAAGFVGMLGSAYVSDRIGKRKPVLILVLLGNALFMLLTATATSSTLAVVFLTATGFFLPAIQGPFWSLPMDLLPSGVMGYSTGVINTGGQIAGIGAPVVIGTLIQLTGHYEAGFLFMAAAAVLAAALVAILKEPSPQAARPSSSRRAGIG